MSIQLYNTLTRQKESFNPTDPFSVKLYCCGPTVYHYAHIGNLRTYIFEDILRRVLEMNGYVVNHVMNVTDVGHLTSDGDEGEDKMKKGAEREKKTVWQIAEHYTQAFLEDMNRLNLLKPTVKPKATDHVVEMISQIEQLEKNGLTYIGKNGNVYYDTSQFADYGKLAQLDKQQLQAGARIEVDENKKNPHDFVLWFVESKHGEQDMQWESPWGRGFPGWHIECSAMATKYLGEHIDIHCGGIDHIPVHHTNEIAQAEGAMRKSPWVKVWMHGEFLVLKPARHNIGKYNINCKKCGPSLAQRELVETFEPSRKIAKDVITCSNCGEIYEDGLPTEKMAKSSENFLMLKSLIEKGYNPLDYRYFCLQAHYRKELSFSWEGLDAARTGLRRMKDKVQNLGEEEGQLDSNYLSRFEEAINDDLNAPQALALAWELLDDKTLDNKDKLSTIVYFDRVLGLKLNEKERVELPPQIVQWILERNQARQEKDWAKADELRGKIEASGKWKVKDGVGGTEVEKK